MPHSHTITSANEQLSTHIHGVHSRSDQKHNIADLRRPKVCVLIPSSCSYGRDPSCSKKPAHSRMATPASQRRARVPLVRKSQDLLCTLRSLSTCQSKLPLKLSKEKIQGMPRCTGIAARLFVRRPFRDEHVMPRDHTPLRQLCCHHRAVCRNPCLAEHY
ncbi:hypothetical protein IF2G_02988 [Cordyceps javanica]|nr:hypothetical protein IF2G_02988 [Cordyceps javanica]